MENSKERKAKEQRENEWEENKEWRIETRLGKSNWKKRLNEERKDRKRERGKEKENDGDWGKGRKTYNNKKCVKKKRDIEVKNRMICLYSLCNPFVMNSLETFR